MPIYIYIAYHINDCLNESLTYRKSYIRKTSMHDISVITMTTYLSFQYTKQSEYKEKDFQLFQPRLMVDRFNL